MKKLSIKCDNTVLNTDGYGVDIGGKGIEKMIMGSLPKGIKHFKNYPVKVVLLIEFLDNDKLKIETEGYELPKEDAEEVDESE